jgi:hypothetical protein
VQYGAAGGILLEGGWPFTGRCTARPYRITWSNAPWKIKRIDAYKAVTEHSSLDVAQWLSRPSTKKSHGPQQVQNQR